MILPLSTAGDLCWLGRYMYRTITIQQRTAIVNTSAKTSTETNTGTGTNIVVATNTPPVSAETYLALMGINSQALHENTDEQTRTEHLARQLNTVILPALFNHINDNVQTVRGVIDRDAYQLFNDAKSLKNDDSLRAACLQLHACCQAMRAQETTVAAFWSLGFSIEQLDEHLRINDAISAHFRQFAVAATSLPDYPAWNTLKLPAQALVFTQDHVAFTDWLTQFYHVFDQRL
ncbi:alpha-E domain-containing protein [Ostreibacterium oceani]|uniref:DUF403 domain-containing protein n=1 Tax=Ostreibacterium oceani TaxID=2654998 RepID=A0A6N7F2V4_9GAMM|nr:alpha-E domain-containing protein [Ostreibacterium oceani]MPV86196.1 hypothetical protein [Ostreibacterium oceani]